MYRTITDLKSPHQLATGIKLLCFDLDGTLINSKGEISSSSIQEISRLKRQGIEISLATGRPLFTSEDIIDLLGVEGASMFYSGSLVTDVITRIPILECHLLRRDTEGIITFARENNIPLELYTGEEFFVDQINEFTQIHIDDYLKVSPRELDLLKLSRQERFLKAVLIVERGSAKERVLREFNETLSQCVVGSATGAKHPNMVFYNLTNRYASRIYAFEALLEYYNIKSEEVMCFGDAPADIPFLSLAGVGIAMGNSDEETKAKSKIVTSSVEDEGVATALKLIFS